MTLWKAGQFTRAAKILRRRKVILRHIKEHTELIENHLLELSNLAWDGPGDLNPAFKSLYALKNLARRAR